MFTLTPSFVDALFVKVGNETLDAMSSLRPTGFGGEMDMTSLIAVCISSYAVFISGLAILGVCAGRRLNSFAEEFALESRRMSQRYEYLLLSGRKESDSESEYEDSESSSEDQSSVKENPAISEDVRCCPDADTVWPKSQVVHDLRS